jgi:hypothetical protein
VGDNQKIEDHFVYAAPGGMVKLEAEVSDPDGDDIYTSWWLYSARSSYNGTTRDLSPANPASPKTTFTVPADATPGQYFNFVIQARDNDAPGQPMTRFNQVVVHVVDASDPRVAQYAATTAPTAAAIDAGITVAMAEPVVKGKPGAPATLAAHVSGNTGNAVKMFWRVNGGTFTPANGNSHQLLRTWDLSNYTTNFTIPQGAADGVTIVVELWGGAVGQVPSKYGQVTVQADTSTANDPKITNVTASPNQIVQGEAVDITVAVEGQNLEGRTVTATILGKTAQVVNGTAVVSLTAEDVFEFGLFCTRVEVEGTWIKYDYDPDGFIRAYTRPDDLMSPTVTTEGDNTVIIFSKDTQEFAKTDEWRQYFILDAAFDDAEKAVAIGARTVANDKVSAEGNVITIGEKAYPGQTIKLSGVTLSDLYPGPYTFTLAVSATTAGIAAPEILNIDQGKVLRYGIALGHVSGTNRIELAAKFDNTKLDYAGSVLNLPASLNAEFFGAPA